MAAAFGGQKMGLPEARGSSRKLTEARGSSRKLTEAKMQPFHSGREFFPQKNEYDDSWRKSTIVIQAFRLGDSGPLNRGATIVNRAKKGAAPPAASCPRDGPENRLFYTGGPPKTGETRKATTNANFFRKKRI